jgi:hypothetical protein
MNRIRKIMTFLLTLALVITSTGYVFANNRIDDEMIRPYYYIETNKRLIKTEVIRQKPIGWASGQNEKGHTFLGSRGSICWSPNEGKNVGISLGPNYKFLSLSVSVGLAFGSNATYCSEGLAPNVAWKLYTYADIEVKTYLVDFDESGAKGTKKVYEKRVIKTYTKPIRVD